MVENDMRKSVVDWLANQVYEDAHECMVGGYCDVIGFRFAPRETRVIPPLKAVIAIELKMNNVAAVVWQCRGNQRHVNASYAAMPRKRCDRMRQTTREKFTVHGIGLLAVDGEDVLIEIPAVWVNDGREQNYKRTWWRWHLRNTK